LAVIAFPIGARNALLVGDYVPIAAHGGLNLYIGNNPSADGTYVALPGIRPNIEGQAADARVLAQNALGRQLEPAEVSSYFAGKAADFWRDEPVRAVSLFVRKIGLTLNRVDLALNQSFTYYQDSESPMLGVLLIGPLILFPLGILGLVATVRRSGWRYAPVLVLPPAYLLSVAIFFVSSRYRMPLLVPMALFSAIGIDWLIEALRTRRLSEAVPPLVAAALSLPVVLHDFRLNDGSAEEALAHIEFLIDNRRVEEAIEKTTRAEQKATDLQAFRLRLGRAYLRQGHVGPAAAQLSRTEAGLINEEKLVIAEYFLVSGDPFSASRFFEAALLSGQPRTAGLLGRYGEALALAGNTEAAIAALQESVRLDPARPRVLLNLAVTLANSNRFTEAREMTRASLDLDPKNEKAQALLRALDEAQAPPPGRSRR
jgi:tetratricopeptide (TPR) repeat protein